MSEARHVRDEYTCARCGGTFITDWSEEEARAEARENFSEAELAAPQEVVCDDCYRELMARRQKQVVPRYAGWHRPPSGDDPGQAFPEIR